MRYLIVSDIHANLDALRSVLEKAKKIGYDKVIFLGDAVGYGPEPIEVINELKAIMDFGVRGNHDEAILNERESLYFNEIAYVSYQWTKERLMGNEEAIEFLRSLSYVMEIESGIFITHSTLTAPTDWRYILTPYEAFEEFASHEFNLMLYGHTHVPVVYEYTGEKVLQYFEDRIDLNPYSRYIINPGSVGQPRDGDPRAAFGILDTDEKYFKFYRVEYDIESQKRKIFTIGLPEILAVRLEIGR